MDWCSTQVLDFDEPDSSSANDNNIPKFQVAVLKVLAYKSYAETSHPVYTGVNSIGRGAECTIQILIPSVSTEHASIEVVDDCHFISDLGSRNKTKRGKVFLKPNIKYELKFDDEITFGDVVCQYIPSNESIGDSSFLSNHEVNGLASDLILQSDSDAELDDGLMGEISFPVVQETPFQALNSSRISSSTSIGEKLELKSDSETDIDDDLMNEAASEVEEANEIKQKLERADTAPLKKDNESSTKVEGEKAKIEDNSAEGYNSDFETQPLPWAKRKPIVSDDDTDIDDDIYNEPTQRFPGFMDKSYDEDLLNAKTQLFSSDLDRSLSNEDEEKEGGSKVVEEKKKTEESLLAASDINLGNEVQEKDKQVVSSSISKVVEENKNAEAEALVASDLNSTKLSVYKGKQVENIPKIEEVKKVEEVVAAADSNLLTVKGRKGKATESTLIPKINEDQKTEKTLVAAADSNLPQAKNKKEKPVVEKPTISNVENDKVEKSGPSKGETSSKSPSTEKSKIESKTAEKYQLDRSMDLLNSSIYNIDDDILSSSDDDDDEEEDVNETTDEDVISPQKSTSGKGGKKVAKNAKPEEPAKKPGRLSLRSSNVISKKSEDAPNKISTSQTSAFQSVTVHPDVVVTSTPKKSPARKVKSPVKSPLKSPKSTKRNKRKSTPRKLVLTEEDEDIVLGAKTKPVKRILQDSASEDEESVSGKRLKRTTRKTIAERRARSKTPEPSTVVTRRSARDIKKPIKFREEDQSSGSSSTPSTSTKRSLKCVIKTTRKVEMKIEDSQSSISSTPPRPSTSSTKTSLTPTTKTASPVESTSKTSIKTPAKITKAKTAATRTPRATTPTIKTSPVESTSKTPPAKITKTAAKKTPATKTAATKKTSTAKTPTTRTSKTISTPKRAPKRRASDSVIEDSSNSGSSNEFETTPTKRARKVPSPRAALKIAFTGMKSTKTLEKIVKDLGSEVIDSVSECTHLVTDKIRRTCKLLCGISLGCHVLSPDWLKASKEAKGFLNELDYVVRDVEAEEKYDFVLETSLSRAMAKIQFLKNFNVHVTKSVLPPPDEMKSIIESAGGKYLSRMPAKNAKNGTTVIVCGEKDAKACDKARKAGVHVVTPEFILTGVLRQKADLCEFNKTI